MASSAVRHRIRNVDVETREGDCLACDQRVRVHVKHTKGVLSWRLLATDQSRPGRKRSNPSERRAENLRIRFGITVEDYDRILSEQGGGCAICGDAPRPGARRLAVDHDHGTGQVRGILCHRCNQAIGALGDTREALGCVLAYLIRPDLDQPSLWGRVFAALSIALRDS
jgi:hypothetical protein